MARKADGRLSGKQALALQLLYEHTRPGGGWMRSGRAAARTNTLDSLERQGLAAVRGHLYAGVMVEEWQITSAGQEWVEQHPAE